MKKTNKERKPDLELRKKIIILVVVFLASILPHLLNLKQKEFFHLMTDYAPLHIYIVTVIMSILKNYFKFWFENKKYCHLIVFMSFFLIFVFVFSEIFIFKNLLITSALIFASIFSISVLTAAYFFIARCTNTISRPKTEKLSEFSASFLIIFIIWILIFLSYFSVFKLKFTGYFMISMYETLYDILSTLEEKK